MNARNLVPVLALIFLAGCGHAPINRVSPDLGDKAAKYAIAMVGTPYRYGGDSPSRGFNCSGLVHYSYARAGILVPRTTATLRRQSYAISPRELRRGDLLFFDQEGKKSSHVAVYIGNDRFVHAPSSGKTVNVANFNRYWRRHLSDARRLEF